MSVCQYTTVKHRMLPAEKRERWHEGLGGTNEWEEAAHHGDATV